MGHPPHPTPPWVTASEWAFSNTLPILCYSLLAVSNNLSASKSNLNLSISQEPSKCLLLSTENPDKTFKTQNSQASLFVVNMCVRPWIVEDTRNILTLYILFHKVRCLSTDILVWTETLWRFKTNNFECNIEYIQRPKNWLSRTVSFMSSAFICNDFLVQSRVWSNVKWSSSGQVKIVVYITSDRIDRYLPPSAAGPACSLLSPALFRTDGVTHLQWLRWPLVDTVTHPPVQCYKIFPVTSTVLYTLCKGHFIP